jgi:hypothetical protein
MEQCVERGAAEDEVTKAILEGDREIVKHGRWMSRFNFSFGALWQGKFYAIKQVAPVFVEEETQTVVITVYVFYF